MKIEGVQWFTATTATIGIVWGEEEFTGERQAFISQVFGINEKTDAKWVAEYGARILPQQMETIVKYLTGGKKKKGKSNG